MTGLPHAPSLDTIARFTAATFGVRLRELLSHRRHAPTALARQVAYWVARDMTGLSLPRIGMFFDRDHTSVLHGIRRIDSLMETEPGIRSVVTGIRDGLALPPEAL